MLYIAEQASPQQASHTYKEACALEIKRQEGLKAEVDAMMAAWERYSDLLKAYDELVQSKSRVGLILPAAGAATAGSGAAKGKGGGKKALAPIVPTVERDVAAAAQLHPYELQHTLDTALASALQADAALRKGQSSLQFYKEQVREVFAEMHQLADEATEGEEVAAAAQDQHKTAQASSAEDVASLPSTPTPTVAAAVAEPFVLATASQVKSPQHTPTATCLICRERLFVPTANTPYKARITPSAATPQQSSDQGKVVVLPCAHRYHECCISGWVRKHKTCPLCKAHVTVKELLVVGQYGGRESALKQAPQHVLDAFSHTQDHTSSASAASGQLLLNHAAAPNTEAAANTVQATQVQVEPQSSHVAVPQDHAALEQLQQEQGPRVRLVGKWGTKVDRLVSDLLQLVNSTNHTDEKAIVFSQWTEVRCLLTRW
jgi:hypothetical protein